MKKQTSTPLVSVIITTYNHEKYIENSINSVISQSFKDFEIIVINDGSVDGTADIVERLVSEYPNTIRFVNHKTNQRPKISGNEGISLARGKYIAWNDGDDIWYPQKLEKQITILEDSDEKVGLVYTFVENIIVNNSRFRSRYWSVPPEDNLFPQLFASAFFFKISMMVKRDVYKEVGILDERFPYCADYNFLLRTVAKGFKFLCVPEVLVGHRIHDSNETSNIVAAQKNTKEMLLDIAERFKNQVEQNKISISARLAVCDLAIARHSFIKRENTQAWKYLIKVLKKHPEKILYKKSIWAYMLLSFVPKWLLEKIKNISYVNKLYLAS